MPAIKCVIEGGAQCLDVKTDPTHCGGCATVCKLADAGGIPPGTQVTSASTYSSAANCQGTWDVYCNNTLVGNISTLNKACTGSAMTNGCSITFTPQNCTSIRLVAGPTGSGACCGSNMPDSMVVAVSAW